MSQWQEMLSLKEGVGRVKSNNTARWRDSDTGMVAREMYDVLNDFRERNVSWTIAKEERCMKVHRRKERCLKGRLEVEALVIGERSNMNYQWKRKEENIDGVGGT